MVSGKSIRPFYHPPLEFLANSPVSLSDSSEDRVRKGADKLKMRLKSKQQGRLDGFFTVQPKDPKDVKKRKVPCFFLTKVSDATDLFFSFSTLSFIYLFSA